MGRRYQSILKYLNEPFDALDIKNVEPQRPLKEYDRFIIATPTDTHLGWIRTLDSIGKPIFCEKPLSTDMEEVKEILDCKSPLSMMMQYQCIPPGEYMSNVNNKDSFYSYFRHGNDGLKWDCFQIIALAEERIILDEESPIWMCRLNGRQVSLLGMDSAYITATQAFLWGKYIDRATLRKWHQKVSEFTIK